MAIERKFTVGHSKLNGKYLVFAHGIGGPTAVAEAREEIFAETLASRLNEAYADTFDELTYLILVGKTVMARDMGWRHDGSSTGEAQGDSE